MKASSDIKTDFSCGIIPVLVDDVGGRRYLLIQHKAGHWGFPKGHPKPNETPVDTALRELAEETGITQCHLIEKPAFVEHYISTKQSGVAVFKTVTFYIGYVDSDQVTTPPDEILASAWGDNKQTRDRITYEESKSLLDQIELYFQTRR